METILGSRVLDPRANDPGALADADPYLNRANTAVVPGRSAASWGAIIAGASVAVSVSLILLALGPVSDLLKYRHGRAAACRPRHSRSRRPSGSS